MIDDFEEEDEVSLHSQYLTPFLFTLVSDGARRLSKQPISRQRARRPLPFLVPITAIQQTIRRSWVSQ